MDFERPPVTTLTQIADMLESQEQTLALKVDEEDSLLWRFLGDL